MNSPNTNQIKREYTTYTYKKEWEREKRYSEWVKRSIKGNLYYHCKICNVDRKCSTKGKNSLTVHHNSEKHKKNSEMSLIKMKTNEKKLVQAQGSMIQTTPNEVLQTPSSSNTQTTVRSSSPPPPVATYQIASASKKIEMNELFQAQGLTNQSKINEVLQTSSTSNTRMTVGPSPPPVATYQITDTKTAANKSLMDTCSPSSSPLQDSISLAKIKMSWYLAKRKLQLDKTEDLENLIQSVCPDSEIAKHLTLKETHVHSIISDVTGNIAQQALINTLIKEKFSLIVDENLDLSTKQLTIMIKEIKKFKCLTFLDPKLLIKRESEDSIARLGNFFKGLCPKDMTELDREWRKLRNHKSLSNYDLTIKAQDFWKNVSEMKKDNFPIYPMLSQLVRSLLALPYSSANNQRIFSSINMLAASVPNRKTEMLQGLLHIQSLTNNSEPTEELLNLFNKIFGH